MAKLSHTDSRRMYSWWWDSHISPKNSKWLQENLTDMDAKVKVMIKLIEEDADSFARRAEMYYKKRPELMRMVEEFYRAYRALAERYDHATGVIRHAHRTMAEAFPNQVPSMFADDSPVFSGTDPRTPNEDAFKQNGELTDDSDTVARRRALKQQLNDPLGSVERVRKGLNFYETVEKEHTTPFEKLSKPDEERESMEILKLKEYIAKLESEKEAGLVQYEESVDKLSQLELEVSQTREDFRVYSERATKAENEVVILKESLSKLESEKELKLREYERSLERLSDLEAIISTAREDTEKSNQRACLAETEAQSLRGEQGKMAVEKDAALDKYLQSLEAISKLENKLRVTEEDATQLKERAEKAESEVEILKQTISKLTDDKEAAALQYQQRLETISSLEDKLTRAQNKAKLLNQEIDSGVSKLKGAEEKCLLLERSNQCLHSELESLMLKMGTQTQDLTEKQKELGQLWASLQEERLRFVEAETAFQTLQHLHAQTQEELRSMASELQKRAQLLNISQTHKQNLQDEVLKVKEENKHLDELNASSSLSIKEMQNEISDLKDSKGKLEEEVELRLDERNALQQEIYCLKEELNGLQKKHHSVVDQVHMVGLNPDSFGPSVRDLKDENSNLKEARDREKVDKEALMGKLELMEQLLEKNAVLETSISDLNAELDAVRGKIETLEQSLQSLLKEKSSLLDEKASLMTKLQEANKNLKSLTENNTVMANSLSDARYQLQMLVVKAKTLEDSCQLLENEKSDLISEKHGLNSQLEDTLKSLEELGKHYGELEGRYTALEEERDSNLLKVQELQSSLEVARQEHGNYIQISESRLLGVEAEMRDLHKECWWRKRELDEMIDFVTIFEIEIFVLQRTAQELKQNNVSLMKRNQQLLEKSTLSEKIMSQLQKSKVEQQVEIKSLSDLASSLRAGTCQLLKVLDIVHYPALMDKTEPNHFYFDQLFSTIQDLKTSLYKADEENQHWAVELSVLVEWIRQLRLEAQNLDVEKSNIEHEFKERSEQLSAVQIEVIKHLETNENLRLKLKEGDCNKEALMIQIQDLQRNLMDMQGTCETLRREKSKVYEEKRSLMEKFLHLEEKNNVLEEENCVLCDKVLGLDNLSLILKSCAEEKSMDVRELSEERNKLHDVNGVLVGKLSLVEGRLEESKLSLMDMQGTCETLRREKSEVYEEKRSLMEKFLYLEEKNNALEEENCVLCDKVLALDNLSLIFKSCAKEKSMAAKELSEDRNKLHDVNGVLVGKLSSAEGRLEESKLGLMDMQGTCETLRREKSEVYEEKISLMEKFLHLEEKNIALEEENCFLCDKVLALDNLSLILRSCAKEKSMAVRELSEDRNKLHDVNGVLVGKLSLAEGRLEESKLSLMDMQGNYETLRREKSEVYEEKRSLIEKFLHLEEKNNVLEEENCVLCDKVLALDNLSLILRSCAKEISMAVRELGDDRNKLHDVNDVLVGKLSLAKGRLEESNIEVLHLKQQLQRSENELNVISTVKDQLSDNIENGKNMLHQMKLELQEAEQKITIAETKKFDLHKIVEDLKFQSNEFKTIRDDQENQIFNLSTTNDHLSVENNRLREASQILEGKFHYLHEELNISRSDGEALKNDLKMKGEEIDELEIQASSVFGQLQNSMVCQLLFKQKYHDLEGACLDYIDQNEGLKNQLAAFHHEIVSLKACIASLENHTDRQIKPQNPEDKKLQVAEVINDMQGIDFNEDEKASMQDMLLDLRDLRARLQAYEKASAATREAMVQESVDLHSKLDTSLRKIEFLKSESWRYRSLKQTSEISEAENTLLMKDIMLDQISNGSPYGVSMREPNDMDNQIVELPENIDPIKNQKGGFLAADGPLVNESSMDKLEISKRLSRPVQEENKKKVLERLDSDVQKLANLQITVQDLKRKLQVTETGKRGKSVIQCEALKGKLEEADVAIMKLFDFNGRLIKTVENSTFSDVKSSFDLEGDGNARRRVSEQAQRMSEKIGRLQLEVQKLQFIFLKLDDGKEGKHNISDIKRRVLLRDYLYGGRRPGLGQKMAPFCGCFEPSTVDR